MLGVYIEPLTIRYGCNCNSLVEMYDNLSGRSAFGYGLPSFFSIPDLFHDWFTSKYMLSS